MTNKQKIQKLKSLLKKLYIKNSKKLLFHGLHHITFVSKKAAEFARPIGASAFLAESSGLVHDLNYIVVPNSEPEVGREMREEYLDKAGYSQQEISRIEEIIMEAHTRTRTAKISKEGKALSDGDTLFKALPTTPILFASKYIEQNKVDIAKLAHKVSSEQNKLLKSGIYFYTPQAKKKYLKWARVNLAIWDNVNEALKDDDVLELLSIAKRLKVL